MFRARAWSWTCSNEHWQGALPSKVILIWDRRGFATEMSMQPHPFESIYRCEGNLAFELFG